MANQHPFVTVFETRKPYEVLMVLNAFEETGIPAFGQERSVDGVISAMPTSPIAWGGNSWTVQVARPAEADAKEILSGLPLGPSEKFDIGQLRARTGVGLFWQWVGAGALVVLLAAYFSGLWRLPG